MKKNEKNKKLKNSMIPVNINNIIIIVIQQ